MSDLWAGTSVAPVARGRILAWLADGAREVTWALSSLSREHWTTHPSDQISTWPILRHAHHIACRERLLTLPLVRYALGDAMAGGPPTRLEFERADSAWDSQTAEATADDLLQDIAEIRFELLHRLEAAPDVRWHAGVPADGSAAVRLDTLLLRARQHELEHLAAMWRIALYWDRVSPARPAGLRFHPADMLEESN